MRKVRAHVTVRGRVQGVYFRDSTREEALAAKVNGWVRNLADGSVEAVFEGERGAVERLISWCKKGPPAARVTEVTVDWEDRWENLSGFSIRR